MQRAVCVRCCPVQVFILGSCLLAVLVNLSQYLCIGKFSATTFQVWLLFCFSQGTRTGIRAATRAAQDPVLSLPPFIPPIPQSWLSSQATQSEAPPSLLLTSWTVRAHARGAI